MLPLLTALLVATATATSLSQEQDHIRRQKTIVDNPPLDEPLLAVQIGGIVGAYIIFVAITITLLLVVGRRLRRTVQSSNFTLQVEMMKPKAPITTTMPAHSTDPSPVTPTNKSHGFRSWSSLTKGHTRGSNNDSVSTIDHAFVVAADRRRAQDQMEMLYAAVMAHDEQRAAVANSPVSPVEDINLRDFAPRSPVSYQSQHANPFSDYPARIPEASPTQHYQHQLATAAAAPPPPMSPRSTTSRRSRLSNLSLFHSNRDSQNSTAQPSPNKIRSPCLPLRKLPISSPLASPYPASPNSDQIPLSPRLYNPPPPPVPPITRTSTSTIASQDRPRVPAALNLTPGGHSSSSLPFREAYPQLLSAPPTKTTYLERPEKQLNGPRTGLPTPYSPYMPFTPLTPLTPSRMITKKQRKREGREHGLKALNEEDAVRDNEDMWGY
ncbi:hypothetical protein BJX70DRAFT_177994 [Aspergillus crustosus]